MKNECTIRKSVENFSYDISFIVVRFYVYLKSNVYVKNYIGRQVVVRGQPMVHEKFSWSQKSLNNFFIILYFINKKC